MKTVAALIENLKPYQQQACIDMLSTIQEQKHLTSKQVGLVGCSIEYFPVEEIRKMFSGNPDLKRASDRSLAEYGYNEQGLINLKKFAITLIEEEVERRVEELTQKDLFDLAEDDDN